MIHDAAGLLILAKAQAALISATRSVLFNAARLQNLAPAFAMPGELPLSVSPLSAVAAEKIVGEV